MSGLVVRLRQNAPIPLDTAIDCAPGELLALFGPSGAGKSTVLRAIAGLERIACGCVIAGGEVWFDTVKGRHLPAHARKVGLVFQSYALFPHLTAVENVAAALGHLPRRMRRERARALLAQVHLEELADRRPQTLSGGQQQRVALARALAREPRVLLLDEPFAAVDCTTRESLYHELARLRRRLEAPTVLVTHDLAEARLLADRLCLIERGRILQCGPPEAVVEGPVSAAAARLLGHRNVFSGRVTAVREGGIEIAWEGANIRAAQAPDGLAPGETVDWLVPAAAPRIAESAGESGDNRLSGRVSETIRLGDRIFVTLMLGEDGPPLSLQLSAEGPARAVTAGDRLACRLPPERIHLMRRG